jgi:hypothetical protein
VGAALGELGLGDVGRLRDLRALLRRGLAVATALALRLPAPLLCLPLCPGLGHAESVRAQRVSLCGVCLPHQRQYLRISIRSGVFRRDLFVW